MLAQSMHTHLGRLMGSYRHIGTGLASAQEYKASFAILRKVGLRVPLISFTRAFHAAGTSQTPSLMAKRGPLNALIVRGIPNVLIGIDMNCVLAFRHAQAEGQRQGRPW